MNQPVIRFRVYATPTSPAKYVDWPLEPDRPLPKVGDLVTLDDFPGPDGEGHQPLYVHDVDEAHPNYHDHYTHEVELHYFSVAEARARKYGTDGVAKLVLEQLTELGDCTVQGLLDFLAERQIPLTARIDYQECGLHDIVIWSGDRDSWEDE